MNNSIYRKTMENSRNKINARLVNSKKDFLKSTSKPSYILHKMFDNNLVAICISKVSLKLNKHANIRMGILELSKTLMQKFHYDYIKTKYDNKPKLIIQRNW